MSKEFTIPEIDPVSKQNGGSTLTEDITRIKESVTNLVGLFSDIADPTATEPYMLQVRTDSNILQRRNSTDNGWVLIDTAKDERITTESIGRLLDLSDHKRILLIDANASSPTFTLPDATTLPNGWTVTVKKVDTSTNAVTLQGVVDGSTDPTISAQYETKNIITDGVGFFFI